MNGVLPTGAPDVLTIGEAAAIMRCSTRLVSELAREHDIGFNLRGQAGWRFTRADVDRLLATRRPQKTPVIEERRRRRRERRAS